MSTFDGILPALEKAFGRQRDRLERFGRVVVNRDLNGRVRLIVAESWQDDPDARAALAEWTEALAAGLGPHAFSPQDAVLFESEPELALTGTPSFPLEGVDGVMVVDRLATEGNWSAIVPPTAGVPRIVFFSIKGGVGRSTALAAAAWELAEAETPQRVLVLDLDLESPGLSASLLPADRQPAYGVADWLVEDLVENGDEVFQGMVATSALSRNGEIVVVPAHGRDPGEYVAKLGRVWMPRVNPEGRRESWSQRLQRLLGQLEERWKPTVVLIDSRAGIDDVASACVTGLGASRVLLFATDSDQTWSGYRLLFRHWRKTGVVRDIRERLQAIGAMIPDVGGDNYFKGLREHSWTVFSDELYDEVEAATEQAVRAPVAGRGSDTAVAEESEPWSFDEVEPRAPHLPWKIYWHRSFEVLSSLHSRWESVDASQVRSIFGGLFDGLRPIAAGEGSTE